MEFCIGRRRGHHEQNVLIVLDECAFDKVIHVITVGSSTVPSFGPCGLSRRDQCLATLP